jgi:hypothetical protein
MSEFLSHYAITDAARPWIVGLLILCLIGLSWIASEAFRNRRR